ncbi:hypothetical protein SAMN04488087_1238 [Rhodothermus profundi]|uniref:Response regulatory domain-containing protein n=1 Tax=Rhodothermus profundi TaxID=633813 RepID=A0A1M6SUX1_9BACT|nr:hypothetical protein SAMN04488087_1238 [Rhodothermus profundi]
MQAINHQASAGRAAAKEPLQSFLNELLAVIQSLQVQLQKVPHSEKTTETPPVVQRFQVADTHWVASLVEIHSVLSGRLLVLEARGPRPDWTRIIRLRREMPLADVPLLVVLQEDNPQVITEAYQVGADACLVRPVNPAQLLGIALYLLRRGRRRAA